MSKRRLLRSSLVVFAAVAAVAAAACGGGGLKTVSKDGYRAILSFSTQERFKVAVRGEVRRVELDIAGSPLVKVVRPDLKKVWQYRPATKKLLETDWSPTEEIVPGYPLEPRFDPEAYASRFGGQIRPIDDATHGLHPCDRWDMVLPSGDKAIIWAARDLEGLVVKIEHAKKDQGDEHQPFTTTELLDVQVGANPKLFEKPEDYTPATSYEELLKP